jgi:2-dehydro-3-deoxyphosphogluconate aldolase / (4S)-4-hydroxy-2-oxoglutarate aldolase
MISIIQQQKVVPLFYHEDEDVCIAVTKALYQAGIRCIEFTNRGINAVTNAKAIIALRNEQMQDLHIYIGTIKTVEDVAAFTALGVDGLISPFYDADIATATKGKVNWIPGCMTPTEIHTATKAGYSFIKLFPGNILGTAFVTSIKELFPTTAFMVTGGVEVTKENLEAWFNAGVVAVGIGSKLITKKLLEEKGYATIAANTKVLLSIQSSINTQP